MIRRSAACTLVALLSALSTATVSGADPPPLPEPTRVTAHVRGAKADVVFGDLFKQAVLTSPTWDGGGKPGQVDLDAERQPFWPVVLDVCDRYGISIFPRWQDGRVNFMWDGGRGSVGQRVTCGAVTDTLRVLPFYDDAKGKQASAKAGEPADATVVLDADAYFDPAIRVVAIRPAVLTAVTVAGRSVPLVPRPGVDDVEVRAQPGFNSPWVLGTYLNAHDDAIPLGVPAPTEAEFDKPTHHPRHQTDVAGTGRFLLVTDVAAVTLNGLAPATTAADPAGTTHVRVERVTRHAADNGDRLWDVDLTLSVSKLDAEARRLICDVTPNVQVRVTTAGGAPMKLQSLFAQPTRTSPDGSMPFRVTTAAEGGKADAGPAHLTLVVPVATRWVDVPFRASGLETP